MVSFVFPFSFSSLSSSSIPPYHLLSIVPDLPSSFFADLPLHHHRNLLLPLPLSNQIPLPRPHHPQLPLRRLVGLGHQQPELARAFPLQDGWILSKSTPTGRLEFAAQYQHLKLAGRVLRRHLPLLNPVSVLCDFQDRPSTVFPPCTISTPLMNPKWSRVENIEMKGMILLFRTSYGQMAVPHLEARPVTLRL